MGAVIHVSQLFSYHLHSKPRRRRVTRPKRSPKDKGWLNMALIVLLVFISTAIAGGGWSGWFLFTYVPLNLWAILIQGRIEIICPPSGNRLRFYFGCQFTNNNRFEFEKNIILKAYEQKYRWKRPTGENESGCCNAWRDMNRIIFLFDRICILKVLPIYLLFINKHFIIPYRPIQFTERSLWRGRSTVVALSNFTELTSLNFLVCENIRKFNSMPKYCEYGLIIRSWLGCRLVVGNPISKVIARDEQQQQ